ncbi:MAG: class 3 adenylate cyclase [Paracoccaceae bacterium]|jgi:class 3 adenylate cyclase
MVMVGDGMALDCTVIAEAPNMATRLQALAKAQRHFRERAEGH